MRRLSNWPQMRRFLKALRCEASESVSDYCFQKYMPGEEKRLWFTGDTCVGGRAITGRPTPWSRSDQYSHCMPYRAGESFERDLSIAQRLWRLSGLKIGSVDFLGDHVNEINGAGTVFTCYNKNWQKVSDVRAALVSYLVDLLK